MRVTVTINIDDKIVHFVRKAFTRRRIQALVIVAMMGATVAYTATRQISKQYLFNSGDVVVASEINQNFADLNRSLDDISNIDIALLNDEINAMVADLTKRNNDIQGTLTGMMYASIPEGVIALWHGTIGGETDGIPPGWVLCDGTNGTPDLRDKFVVVANNNAGAGFDPHQTDDNPTHVHDILHWHSGISLSGGDHSHQWASAGMGSGKYYWQTYKMDKGSLVSFNLYEGADMISATTGGGYYPVVLNGANTLYTEKFDTQHTHDFNVNSRPLLKSLESTYIPPYHALFYIMRKAESVE